MTNSITLFGLATCDSTRGARAWLDAHGIVHAFHDVRSDGLKGAQVDRWFDALGWEKVLNKASTTWRRLPEAMKQDLSRPKARALLLEHPTLVKRPLLDRDGKLTLGFKPAIYADLFSR